MAEVKKKIRPGAIELHVDELALVVHYEVQEVVQQPDGTQEVTSSSQATKKITVKSLNERTHLPALAAEVVDKCKLIHPSKVGLVQDLLQQLQQRQPPPAAAAADSSRPASNSSSRSGGGTAPAAPAAAAAASPTRSDPAAVTRSTGSPRPGSSSSRPDSASTSPRPASAHKSGGGSSGSRIGRQQQQRLGGLVGGPDDAETVSQQQQKLQQRSVVLASEIFDGIQQTMGQQPAFFDEIESYVEDLYDEELSKRAAAAGMLCQLFRNTSNLTALLESENLLSTLARLLREDGMKSLELATAVAGCFFACSCLQQLHRLLLENQIGTILMDLLSLELLQRSAALEQQEGPGSSPAAIAAFAAAAKAGQVPAMAERERRLGSLVVRQDRFLYIATATLLHLAEDTAVQRKMRKRDIVGLLAAMLSRPHVELLLLATGFLRRLCVFQENKDRLASLPNTIPQLLSLILPGCGEHLQTTVLRLLHNLSFDSGLRQQMIQGGLVPQAVALLDNPQTAPLAAGLLYQLSIDDDAKGLFIFCQGALQRLYESIMRAMGASGSGTSVQGTDGVFAGFAGALSSAGGDLRSIPELIALAVNLAHNRRTAEWFSQGEKLERLLKRSIATADELAWKLLHNLVVAGGEDVSSRLLVHARGVMALLQSPNTGPELFLEVLGTLAAACDAMSSSSTDDQDSRSSSSSRDLSQSIAVEDVLGLLHACLTSGNLEDDAMLEAVVLLGALAGRPEFASAIANTELISRLVELITLKRADDEFVLQVCWAFSKFLMQPITTAELLNQQAVVPYLVDLMQDNNMAVKKVAGGCLDVIMDSQYSMAGTIRGLKFESHNQEWLRLAGPAAHAIMMAAAAAAPGRQQQQQYQMQQQQARPQVIPQQQYTPPAVQQYVDTSNQGPQDDAHDGYSQMQWVNGAKLNGYDNEYDNDSNNYTDNSMHQQQQPGMQIQAGGQRMVLDLNEYVQGVDDFYGISEQGDAVMAS